MKSLFIIPVLALIVGCAGTQAAYEAADGLEETAFVMKNHYLALVLEADVLKQSGDLSGNALLRTQTIVADSKPLIDSLSDVAQAYKAFQSAETQQELTDAIAAVAVELSNLLNAIRNAGGSAELLDRIEQDIMPLAA